MRYAMFVSRGANLTGRVCTTPLVTQIRSELTTGPLRAAYDYIGQRVIWW